MRVLIATDSVHTTAAACDYLEPRLDGDDAVAVVTVPTDEARDAADALNVATARLLGRADVETTRLDAGEDAADAILAAVDERSPDTVVVGRHAGTPGASPGLGGTARRVVEGAGVPVVVVVPSA
ncbi:UspA domain protein [Natronomonas moolapensis 8.8.11]|uniref:UspA domain protein n=1 Tax=Natronomonas moolapensis (strain DSM 18674 / CECT 7526 / JCM 14361 / 8.8.11) TaxID=268739 RepID=M1Y1P8_NATM8|nr:universal stress protein [Natronomonas moolapensis]CCQ36397.1 UspA domain protein [Natronomonas moolapensis 8.8.11]